jgi:diguanylate cyclase (GGDEF) domain
MSIKKSLQLTLIMASVIPVIVVSIIAHKILTDNIIIENKGYLQRTAEMNTSGLDSLINIQKTEVSLLSLQDEIIKTVTASNITGLNASESVNNFLSRRNFTYRKGIHISVYNSSGKIIASSERPLIGIDNSSNETYLDIMRYGNDSIHARLIQNKTNSKTPFSIEVGAPILDNSQKAIGCIVSTISTSYFHDLLNKIEIGDTGYAILLNQDGTIVYHPNLNFIGNKITSKKLSNLVEDYLIDDISQNNSFVYKYAGHKKAFGYCILPELNMVLIVQQDISDICSTTTFIFQLLCVECVIIMGFVILIAGYLTKKYTQPIIALRDAMRIASDGNLTVQSNIKSNNELGELSKNFNKMLHIIKTNYEDLESMHEELLSNEEQLRSNYDHIEFLAYHDTLTKLPNKLAFLDNVNAILEGSQTSLMRHAVYFVDLDNFKTVNDTLGHEYGDKLLAKTAHILTSLLGSEGMIARAGGDEFLLFKENILSNEEANDFASEIIQHFANPLDLNGEVVYVSMSIGIALYPENGTTSNVLIKNADIAMYKSKDTGKNKYTLFDKKMEEELSRNTQILEILRNAIDSKEIYIEYQPLLDLSTNSVISFEALMRIKNERLGIINPSEFIPIAEESGIIIELSAWLLKEVCSFNKQLIDLGAKPRHVCVNISSVQINRPGFINLLSDILEETQLPPQYLELEITESTLVSSIMDATMLLTNLQNLGVRISLDDFGTGYSSLNYLTNMPIDTLKIDKSFVDNICVNRKDTYIAESIIQLAHSLDVRVVAEGVEHEDQLIALKKMHCHVIQGFVYSRPLSPIALIDLLSEDDLITQRTLF